MNNKSLKHIHKANSEGAGIFYFLGLIGALIYFYQQASTFQEIIIGILKSFIWPAYFVYHIFTLLNL